MGQLSFWGGVKSVFTHICHFSGILPNAIYETLNRPRDNEQHCSLQRTSSHSVNPSHWSLVAAMV